MKKLLSLLSILIISGTAAPTTIAASTYQKEKQNILNDNFSFLQINNLRKLKKEKRYIIDILGKVYFMNNHSRYVTQINILNNHIVKNVTIVGKDINSNNLRAGSVFFTTGKGIYLVPQQNHDWTLTKIDGLWTDIVDIKIAPTGSIYFIEKYDLYYVITNTKLGLLNKNDDQTIINAVKRENNLANLNYSIRNKTNNSAEFWIDNNNDYYKQWSWKKVYFKSNRYLTENDINYNNYFYLNNNSIATKINISSSEIKNVLIVKTVPGSDAIYFSTANGIYYMSSTSWKANKIKGIDEPIAQIEIDKDNRAYFTSLILVNQNSNCRKLWEINNQNPGMSTLFRTLFI